jgi:hypothetical protein
MKEHSREMDEGLGIAVPESRLCFADMAWLAPLHARVMRAALVGFHPVAPRFGQRLPVDSLCRSAPSTAVGHSAPHRDAACAGRLPVSRCAWCRRFRRAPCIQRRAPRSSSARGVGVGGQRW